MTITMHLCRGNYKSTFMGGTGGYEAEQEVLFNRIKVHGYFMEYDTERAGGFEPLRLVPKGKTVVLGLVTSKTGHLKSKDAISGGSTRRRNSFRSISWRCRRMRLRSTEEGNTPSPRPRWAMKLRMINEVVEEVWGR